MDPDLIEARAVELLPGQGGVEAFNRRLATHVAAHPSLVKSPPRHATRHGWHSGELANDQAPEIDILKEMIGAAVRRRFENPPKGPAHPYWTSRSDTFGMRIWAVIMERGGHQVAHIHPAAWLSGVYYVEVPPDVTDETAGQAGWIELGHADDGFYKRSEPETHAIKPVEGLMVTFPSFFWHRTIPFQSTGRRISVAFDIVPARPDFVQPA
jgi:uncharacterized protein (TIGR02466 family)